MKIAPGSKCMVFSAFGRFFKVALSSGAGRGLRREQAGETGAQQDSFWQEIVLPGAYVGSMLKYSPVGLVASADQSQAVLAKARVRLEAMLPVSDGWPSIFLTLAPLLSEARCTNDFIDALFSGESRASAHGDFCRSNCLLVNGSLFLIDWGNFRSKFWVSYDIIHFNVVREADRDGKAWRQILEERIGSKTMPTAQAARYALCRSELEMEQDVALGRLTPARREKYFKALGWARSMVEDK